MAYLPNPGTGDVPDEALLFDTDGNVVGARKVHVRLHGGYDSRCAGHDPWPADGGRPPTNWRVSRPPHPFQIREFDPL